MAILQSDGVNNATDLILSRNGTEALRLTSTGTVQLSSINDGPLAGTRNRIINGDMRIDQRNIGALVSNINNTYKYIVDRWIVEESSDAVLSAQQTTDVPAGKGFTNSLKLTATTADASITASQFVLITHIIEGYNIADFGFGAAGATSVTASFWVKSSVTGQYSCNLANNGFSRINPQTFTINSSNTWEKKTVTWDGDTTGTWLTTTGRGIILNFMLAAGSSNLGSAGWNGSSITAVSGQVNAVGTINNTFFLTGVQLEPGTVATPFERRSFGQELALCQRYFQLVGNGCTGSVATSSVIEFMEKFTVPMRVAPTGVYKTGQTARFRYAQSDIANGDANSLANLSATTEGVFSQQTGYSGLVVDSSVFSRNNNSDSLIITMDAEI